jgi:hypothetical protein
VPADLALDEAGLVGDVVHAALVRLQLAVALHRINTAHQRVLRIGRQAQRARQGLRVHRAGCIAHDGQDVFSAGDGMGKLIQCVRIL